MSTTEFLTTATDKAELHSYLPYYDKLLSSRRDSCQNILEIGIQGGGSLYLWQEYFKNATIIGIDIEDAVLPASKAAFGPRVMTIFNTDAYTDHTLKRVAALAPDGVDIIVDDGPHTLESQCWAAVNYSTILAPDGILIIEDVSSIENAEIVLASIPEPYRAYAKVVDLRQPVLPRYDDILVVLELRGTPI